MASEHGGFALGTFMVAGALPALIFYKLIGKVVDRMSARPILVVCDLISAAIMFAVAWLLANESLTLPLAYFFGFAVALVEGFFNPALTKCLPQLIPESDIEQAVAYQSSTQYLASFGGSVLGAFLIGLLGIPLLVLLNAVSYVFSALIEMTLKFPGEAVDDKIPGENDAESSSDEVSDSDSAGSIEMDWKKFPMLRKLLLGFGLVNFFATPVLVVIPLYVQKSLAGGPSMLGMLEAALWVGILLGTFFAAMVRSDGRNIKLGAMCMSVFGLAMFASAHFVSVAVFATSLFVAGITLGLNNVKFVTLFQRVVPSSVKGQFFAAMQAIISFSFPIAYLVFGYLGDLVAPEKLCLIQGGGILVVAAWFYFLSVDEPELTNYQHLGNAIDAELSPE